LDRKIIKFEETLTESGASIARLLPPNSVMVSCIGNLGKIGIIDRPATTNQQINSVVFNNSIVDPFFWFYYALTLKEWLYENSSATTVSIINKGRFEKAPIPVPPLPEQQRIVAKLDTLFGHLDALKTRLDRIPQLLKDFRQKVLTQAVTGKLTEEWREGRELEEIEFEKIKRYLLSTNPSKSNLEKIESIFEEIEVGQFTIPDEWVFSNLNKVCNSFSYGSSEKSDNEGLVPVLRMGNIQNGS
jgi:type I restriction enzyme S subunit